MAAHWFDSSFNTYFLRTTSRDSCHLPASGLTTFYSTHRMSFQNVNMTTYVKLFRKPPIIKNPWRVLQSLSHPILFYFSNIIFHPNTCDPLQTRGSFTLAFADVMSLIYSLQCPTDAHVSQFCDYCMKTNTLNF